MKILIAAIMTAGMLFLGLASATDEQGFGGARAIERAVWPSGLCRPVGGTQERPRSSPWS